MKVLHSGDIFCHAVYQLKLVRFGISTWKHNLSDGRNDCPRCWKVLRGGAVPEPHQQNCWDQPLPAVTQRILHRTLPFSTLSFILTSAKVSSIFPFPVITPDSPAVLLQDLHFFLGFFCLFSQWEKLAELPYIFMLLCFPKAQCG